MEPGIAFRDVRGMTPRLVARWALASLLVATVGLIVSISRIESAMPYYRHVDEATAAPAILRGKRMQVLGVLVRGSLERRVNTSCYRFQIQSGPGRPPATLRATYIGALPERLREGEDVVVTGRLGADGGFVVEPDGILTKCPTRY